MTPVFYNIDETARALRISRRQVFRIIANGDLASVRLGARRAITQTELDRYIAANVTRREAS